MASTRVLCLVLCYTRYFTAIRFPCRSMERFPICRQQHPVYRHHQERTTSESNFADVAHMYRNTQPYYSGQYEKTYEDQYQDDYDDYDDEEYSDESDYSESSDRDYEPPERYQSNTWPQYLKPSLRHAGKKAAAAVKKSVAFNDDYDDDASDEEFDSGDVIKSLVLNATSFLSNLFWLAVCVLAMLYLIRVFSSTQAYETKAESGMPTHIKLGPIET
ncbi:hypothetical protein QBC35DRAFT_41991 [Podospora australis]|uniref:Uncharacterized protein n=1 Tax=Podospora australis TaxID=1536484 RepID=A0AAN6WNR1_9PEZI|nr:hypothetical protein QBC35DRAFT_41991 [Podospora australis]